MLHSVSCVVLSIFLVGYTYAADKSKYNGLHENTMSREAGEQHAAVRRSDDDPIFIDENENVEGSAVDYNDFNDNDVASGKGPDDEDTTTGSGYGDDDEDSVVASGGGIIDEITPRIVVTDLPKTVVIISTAPPPESSKRPEETHLDHSTQESNQLPTVHETESTTHFNVIGQIPDRQDIGNGVLMGRKSEERSMSFFSQPAVIGGAVVGLLCAILLVMFIVYRMRKKDEGSYALDEPKRSPTIASCTRNTNKEFYA